VTDKKPIVLKNVRLSYPHLRRPEYSADELDMMIRRAPSFTMHIPSKWSPLAQAYLWSAVMQAIPATRAIVGHDPQKLLPAPSALNRPMSLWDTDTLMRAIGDVMGTSYEHMAADYDRQFSALMPKPAKPRRYYIEGGHFDMQPPGTFDLDDEYIMFDQGTPTGRRLAPFISPLERAMTETPRWGEAETHPWQDVERYRKEMMEPWPHKVAVVKVASLDFGLIEARVLAAMGDKRVRGVLIDIESAHGEIAGNPQLDLYRTLMMSAPPEKTVAKKAPPAYLKHDPTKRHKRRRKGK
jgi:hypothetical protein